MIAFGFNAKTIVPQHTTFHGFGGLTISFTLFSNLCLILDMRYGDPTKPPTININLMPFFCAS